MPKILLVEDEAAIADTLVYALGREGLDVRHVTLGRAALDVVAAGGIDLVLLDVGLPDLDGFSVCRELRRTSQMPVIFLTARSEEVDRIVGLEIGGDDYVCKPFSPREVATRVKAVLRRVRPSPEAVATAAFGAATLSTPWRPSMMASAIREVINFIALIASSFPGIG